MSPLRGLLQVSKLLSIAANVSPRWGLVSSNRDRFRIATCHFVIDNLEVKGSPRGVKR
jgi:hypothetical protein